jgi:hypothetical protein
MRKLTIAFLLGLMAIGIAAGEDTPAFRITTRRSSDRVEVKYTDKKALFVVHSPIGISGATIERVTERWPDTVVIQLRLKGLESFKLSAEKLKLEASVSSHNGDQRLWKDGNEDALLDSKNPSWMEILIKSADGKATKTIPLNEGCFEMQLPKSFSEGNPKTLTLTWIDFYRN